MANRRPECDENEGQGRRGDGASDHSYPGDVDRSGHGLAPEGGLIDHVRPLLTQTKKRKDRQDHHDQADEIDDAIHC